MISWLHTAPQQHQVNCSKALSGGSNLGCQPPPVFVCPCTQTTYPSLSGTGSGSSAADNLNSCGRWNSREVRSLAGSMSCHTLVAMASSQSDQKMDPLAELVRRAQVTSTHSATWPAATMAEIPPVLWGGARIQTHPALDVTVQQRIERCPSARLSSGQIAIL